ncbi:MAG: 3,4-dioxygenase subunit beta, partial [Gordonia sp. (in: high G+C Gram-positive bacteria)]|uniref:3,4-dioxygenase subunit beta n=1 Tax=Gordonia sp. (in: high G+C Gram-positive bacteria) TaxID=84139 RepID=UPI003BB68F88
MHRSPEPVQTPDGPAFEGRLLPRPDDEVVDQGAGFDIATLLSRRRVLALLGGGAGALALSACSSDSTPGAASSTENAAAVGEIPEETNGPYPADGSNGVNILEQSGIERSDITTNLDGGDPVDGVPLTMTFEVSDLAKDGAAYTGAVLYAWQCDAQGRYSMYSQGVENETFLRGVQTVGPLGRVTFQTIVPGCYPGRWTHLHFEVYPDKAAATNVDNAIATSQLAFPQDMLDTVYRSGKYPDSARNLAQIGGLDKDMVFSDGYALQLGTFTGDVARGYRGSLNVGVDATTVPAMSGRGGGQGGGPGGDGRPGGPP